MRPYRQGVLDGLCGLYSIINSIGYLTRASEEQAEELFSSYVDFIDRTPRRLAEYLKNGIPKYAMEELLREINHNVAEVAFRNPGFHTTTPIGDLWDSIRLHTTETNGCAIIGLNEPWNHWTVVTRVSDSSVWFYDSYGMKRYKRKAFVINTHQKTDLIRIDAGCCFYVWKEKK